MVKQFKVIVEKHPDGYVAYPRQQRTADRRDDRPSILDILRHFPGGRDFCSLFRNGQWRSPRVPAPAHPETGQDPTDVVCIRGPTIARHSHCGDQGEWQSPAARGFSMSHTKPSVPSPLTAPS